MILANDILPPYVFFEDLFEVFTVQHFEHIFQLNEFFSGDVDLVVF